MLRRVFAWAAIIGFLLLILDIAYFKWRIDIALLIYALIIVYFLFTRRNSNEKN